MIPAANLSLLWQELPVLDRFEAAANAGFTSVELLFPYDISAHDLRRACLSNGLELILINAPPPNYVGGRRGFAAVPDLVSRFRSDLKRAYRYTDALNVKLLHVMAGNASGDLAQETFVRNLVWAAKAAPEGLMLTIEPLNPVAMPGYFLNDYPRAARILDAVNLRNVGLQYDSYHAQMLHGDAVAVFEKYHDKIVHVQVGDAPRRSAPGTGDVDFNRLFTCMRKRGYSGWISGEYIPDTSTEASLTWMNQI